MSQAIASSDHLRCILFEFTVYMETPVIVICIVLRAYNALQVFDV